MRERLNSVVDDLEVRVGLRYNGGNFFAFNDFTVVSNIDLELAFLTGCRAFYDAQGGP